MTQSTLLLPQPLHYIGQVGFGCEGKVRLGAPRRDQETELGFILLL